jgi:hypothetical protein
MAKIRYSRRTRRRYADERVSQHAELQAYKAARRAPTWESRVAAAKARHDRRVAAVA